MAFTNCDYPVLGQFKNIALVLTDDCGKPLGGVDTGWVEQCPGAFAMTDDIDEGTEFERRCADDTILVSRPGKKSLKGIDVTVDLHGVDPQFAALAGGSTPVTQDGTVVGWRDCTTGSGNLQLYIWQEVAGGAGCADPTAGKQYFLTILPWVTEIRLTDEGTFGSADSFIRLTGRAVSGFTPNQTGAFPTMEDAGTGTPECLEEPFDTDCPRQRVLTTLAPPTECGFIEITECTPAS